TGVCTATCGPGVTNMVTGVAGAFNESSPVIVIGGDIHTNHFGKGPSNFHEINQENLFRPITKLSRRIEQGSRIGEFMRIAFRTAQSGRKGPVFLGIPRNIQREKMNEEVWPKDRYRSEGIIRGDSRLIDQACELLLKAKLPVILVGGGVHWARAEKEVLELADLMGIPVAVSHKGLVTEDHPWSVGVIGMVGYPMAMDQMVKADLILALGCTFNQVTTASYTNRIIPKDAKLIQVDIDPSEFGKSFPIELGITGDVRSILLEMIERLKAEGMRRNKDGRLKEVTLAKEEWEKRLLAEGAASDAVPIHRLRLMRDLNKALGKDAILAAESGATHGWFYYGFKAHSSILEPGDLSCMGSAWCMAMAAKLAYPERPVVSVTGDGAFMMTLNELATAVNNKIPIVVVVPHNEVYGNVRRKQYEHFEGRFAGSELYIPDLSKVAQSFGAYGERVEKPAAIIPALERALSSGKPAVLDVIIDNSMENLEPPVKLRVKDRY
ncbi:MAG: thiamine pyrophosphate-binding protein, partial [Thermodesulfobacteriota bacterium]|nr:thiamine pyrophosphate-binding protein [Thermodesulfobacteriota bacterium]